ncbi:hypothetical protein ACQP0C_22205 [Nocardia sp. CA-129566]|uniref:hypothetical protein n=1 Tax=Nocardia sp. CA-129566 TaxID=3239976 RepID=UPI003D983D32
MSRTVTVRMYNIGFADCFLVTLTEDERIARILVDCGANAFGDNGFLTEQVVADLTETDSGRPYLDVVVASNPHRDHIAGFASARWQDIGVGEVWLPWVEHPADSEAARVRHSQDRAARGLATAFSATTAEGMLARNALRTERAMWTLRHGFAGDPRRRYHDELLDAFGAMTALPGVLVHILGPARSTDLEPILGAVDRQWHAHNDIAAEQRPSAPFADGYRLTPAQYERRYGDRVEVPSDNLLAQLTVEPRDPFAALCLLDRAMNNQGMFFALEFGDAVLVFPGDTQWAGWQPVLDNPDICRLLARTTIYKVAHHGSYTGTPRRFATEILPRTAISLLSTGAGPWDAVPHHELTDALGAGDRLLVRSDDQNPARPVIRHPTGLWSEITVEA